MARSRRPSEQLAPGVRERIFADQHGVCAICGNPPKTRALHVDHDHRSGRVRGATCFRCNRLLLIKGVNAVLLRAAADYLERDTDYGSLPR